MKTKKIIIIAILIIVAAAIIIRLFMNKQSLDSELASISKFTTVVPVSVYTVKDENIRTSFSINGSFEPMSEVTIASETQGTIKKISAETGDNVREGQILAETDNDLIVSQLELAKANFEKAEKDMQRYEQLSKEDAASQQQSEAARLAYLNAKSDYVSASKQYNNSIIKAPVSGNITKRYIEKGSFIAPGSQTFDIVETNKMKFIAKLTADEILHIKKNNEVEITVDAFPGTNFTGKINAIVIQADDSKRYEVEIVVANAKDKVINPGMFGTAYFKNNSASQTLTIPRKALSGSVKNPEVFVLSGDSVIQRNIVAESINDKYLAVKQGLQAGDVIVISGQINLKNGTKVKTN